jgi:hypothetical protein
MKYGRKYPLYSTTVCVEIRRIKNYLNVEYCLIGQIKIRDCLSYVKSINADVSRENILNIRFLLIYLPFFKIFKKSKFEIETWIIVGRRSSTI